MDQANCLRSSPLVGLKDHELALLRGQGVVLGPLVGEGKLPADLRVDVDAELGSAVRDELLDLADEGVLCEGSVLGEWGTRVLYVSAGKVVGLRTFRTGLRGFGPRVGDGVNWELLAIGRGTWGGRSGIINELFPYTESKFG